MKKVVQSRLFEVCNTLLKMEKCIGVEVTNPASTETMTKHTGEGNAVQRFKEVQIVQGSYHLYNIHGHNLDTSMVCLTSLRLKSRNKYTFIKRGNGQIWSSA